MFGDDVQCNNHRKVVCIHIVGVRVRVKVINVLFFSVAFGPC